MKSASANAGRLADGNPRHRLNRADARRGGLARARQIKLGGELLARQKRVEFVGVEGGEVQMPRGRTRVSLGDLTEGPSPGSEPLHALLEAHQEHTIARWWRAREAILSAGQWLLDASDPENRRSDDARWTRPKPIRAYVGRGGCRWSSHKDELGPQFDRGSAPRGKIRPHLCSATHPPP